MLGIKPDSMGKEVFWRPLHGYMSLLWPAPLMLMCCSSSLLDPLPIFLESLLTQGHFSSVLMYGRCHIETWWLKVLLFLCCCLTFSWFQCRWASCSSLFLFHSLTSLCRAASCSFLSSNSSQSALECKSVHVLVSITNIKKFTFCLEFYVCFFLNLLFFVHLA